MRGIAHDGELRDQIFGRLSAIGLVFGKYFIAKTKAAGIKDDRQMAGLIARFGVFQEFPEHVGKARHRAGGQSVGFAR